MRPKVLTPLLIATRIQATVGNMGIEWCDFSEDMGSITNIFLIPAGNETWLGNPRSEGLQFGKSSNSMGVYVPLPCLITAWDIHFSILACPKLGISKKCNLIQLMLNHMDILKNNHMINPHAILNHPKPADLRILYGTVVFFDKHVSLGRWYQMVLNLF
jgi:hypothetical protein